MMIERYYAFAGLEFTVRIPEEWMYNQERRLGAFRVKAVNDPHVFEFQIAEHVQQPCGKLIAKEPAILLYQQNNTIVRYIGAVSLGWHKAYICAEETGKMHKVFLKAEEFPHGFGVNTVLTSMCAEHLIARNHGFVFHCSYIEHNGKAILFTAPSETGKSTQADLWHQYRNAEIINGDRAAIRLVDDVLMAEGIPFAGSSTYCKNRSLPIAAIVYLAQAQVTTIRRMKGYEAFSRIWEGVSVNTWDKEDVELVSDVVQKTAEQIPVFHMPCTPDESAVQALEQALRKLECL